MLLAHFFGWFSVSKNHANRTIHLHIFKKSRSLAAAWWRRCHHAAAKCTLFLKIVRCLTRLTNFFWPKIFKKHRYPNLVPSKIPCQMCDTLYTFGKRWSFRCSVVTLMCLPLTNFEHFFSILLDVFSVWHTFLVTSMEFEKCMIHC